MRKFLLPQAVSFPSSKMCRHYGTVNAELTLADRVWTYSCSKELDRDINAAINIKNESCRLLGIA
ncbi:MAG: zinc ribbon domain-containing protein [Syntrophomonadaceae bacterium]|nr:zinc ribbon domain-containing protein [Syntrophomonadaceae bacterium]